MKIAIIRSDTTSTRAVTLRPKADVAIALDGLEKPLLGTTLAPIDTLGRALFARIQFTVGTILALLAVLSPTFTLFSASRLKNTVATHILNAPPTNTDAPGIS